MPTELGKGSDQQSKKRNVPSLKSLFFRFLFISSTTPGGGYALFAVTSRDLSARGWLHTLEFNEIFALIQAVPGPVAFNAALLIGKRIAGVPGALVCALGTLIPPFILILLANNLFSLLPDSSVLQGAIKGSYAVALGFVGGILIKMLASLRHSWYWLILSFASALGMILWPAYFLALFILIIIVFYGAMLWKP
jgi:chromate transporter